MDSEVTFNLKKKRGSSSSEDRVNTSDELVNIDCDQFIADCAEEASRSHGRDDGHHLEEMARPRNDGDRPEDAAFQRSKQMTKEAESVEARLISKTGQYAGFTNRQVAGLPLKAREIQYIMMRNT